MLRRNGFYLAVSLLLCSVGFAAPARTTGVSVLPPAGEVFDKYIQATGGRAAWHSKQMQRDEIEGRTLDDSRVILRAAVTTTRSGSSFSEMSIPEVASEGVYKGVAWTWTRLAGPRIKKGIEREGAIRATHMLEEADWHSLYPQSKVDGAEPVEGRLCYRVSLLPSAEQKMEWFDLETGLLAKRASYEMSTSGPLLVSSIVESWRVKDGLKQPRSMLIDRGDLRYRMTILDVQYGTTAKAEMLRYPGEVEAYLADTRAGRALPNAEELIERHIFASGGAAAYQAIRTQKVTGTLDYISRGLVAHTEAWSGNGGRYYQTVDIPGFGKQEEGSDGSVVWERSPILGPRARTRRGLNGLGVTLDAAEVIGWRYLIGQARTEAIERINGRDCYRVRLTAKNGAPGALRWYDKSTGLLYRSDMSFRTEMGDVPAVMTYEEWRPVEGLKWPARVRITAAGQEILFRAEEVALNAKIDTGVFELPEEVRKLGEAHADQVGAAPADMQ